MSMTRLAVSLVVVIIFLVSVFFAASNMQANAPGSPASPTVSPTSEVTTRQPVTVTPYPGGTEMPVVTVSREIPHFYRTVTFGSNRSFALTEEQAWMFAEDYLEKEGITNIRASEVVPLGQSILEGKDNNQDVVWSFRVDRIVSGVNKGGVIIINAADGDVVDYTESG